MSLPLLGFTARRTPVRIPIRTLLRYALWAGLMETAYAKHKHSGLLTAWIFHVTIDSYLIFLPEFYIGLSRLAGFSNHTGPKSRGSEPSVLTALDRVMREVVAENPRYVDYIAPVVIGYLLAHPKFDIYKSDWANRQLFGLGLDSIPHAVTAFAFVDFILDVLASLRRQIPGSDLVRWAAEHAYALALIALALATIGYETGEYLIHLSEVKKVRDDPNRLAMMWSLSDTLQDSAANGVGGVAAILVRNLHRIGASNSSGSIPPRG